jgi:Phage tail tube protein, GTA-gp10
MSADGSIVIACFGDEYRFRLAIGEMRELYEAVNRPRVAIGATVIGPMDILTGLQSGNGWPNDVREIIRLGLIGGGMKPDRALVLIKRFVEPPGLLLSAEVIAYRVLLSALTPSEADESVGKAEPVEDEMATAESASKPSTASVLQ